MDITVSQPMAIDCVCDDIGQESSVYCEFCDAMLLPEFSRKRHMVLNRQPPIMFESFPNRLVCLYVNCVTDESLIVNRLTILFVFYIQTAGIRNSSGKCLALGPRNKVPARPSFHMAWLQRQ